MIFNTTDGNPDGSQLGGSPTEKIALYGGVPIPQRSVPMQANIQGANMAVLTTYNTNVTPATTTLSQTTVEQVVTYGLSPVVTYGLMPNIGQAPTGGTGTTNDFILAAGVSANLIGSGLANVRIVTTGQVNLNWANPTSAALTPSPASVSLVVASGFPVASQTWTPLAVQSMSQVEQVVTLSGINAVGTAVLNASGSVIGINITAGGSGYAVPPAVVIAGGAPNTIQSGTFTPQNVVYTAAAPGGSGASGVAIVYNGAVVGVQITGQGSGYQVAPAVSFVGGNTASLGMAAHVNLPGVVTGIGVGNVRILGPYAYGLTFVNNTTSVLTPPTGTYRFLALNEIPAASNNILFQYTSSFAGIITSTMAEQNVTIPGIQGNDVALGVQNPSGSVAPVTYLTVNNVRVQAPSVLGVQFGALAGIFATPRTNEPWVFNIFRPQPAAPSSIYSPYLTFTNAVTANSCAELSATVTGVPMGAVVVVNKSSSFTNNLSILGARVSATNTIQINFQNISGAAIIPPAEVYTVEVFNQMPSGALNSNIQSVNLSAALNADLTNEIRDTLAGTQAFKGA
jgi:hypothetical protein